MHADRKQKPTSAIERELPPYTYVPGHAPHPISASDGHMRETTLPETWSLEEYLAWGIRLFNQGFYWEAHEAWEHLWLELGRTSEDAMIVKGLIKLAACGVKCREANASGTKRHASRAFELLRKGSRAPLFECCNLDAARESASRFMNAPPMDYVLPSDRPVVLPEMQI